MLSTKPGPTLVGPGEEAGVDRSIARFGARAMGSPLRLLLVEPEPVTAEAVWERVVGDIEVSELTMSRFRPESELSRLNGIAGEGPAPVSPRLYRALAAARRAWRVTNGAFDPRVRADLERLGYRGAMTVRAAPPTAPGGRPETPWIHSEPRTRSVRLAEPIDLGGIGKGLALRWALGALARHDDRPAGALIESGGDIVLAGLPPAGDRWTIWIDDPLATGAPVVAVALGTGAISTSAATRNRWAARDGSVVHHIIDPRTGEPVDRGVLQVTVAGPDPAWTEVWCKVLYLAGTDHIEAEARRRGIAAWWVEDDGTLRMTPLARLVTVWTARD